MRKRFIPQLIWISIIIALCIIVNSKQKVNNKQGWQRQYLPFEFGSNKPHLMFHIGSRDAITHNMAYGYWLQRSQSAVKKSSIYQSMFSQLRYKYQNTQNEIYINMLNNDGQKIIWQQIKDNRYKIQSQIKYIYEKDEKNNNQENNYEYEINWKHFNTQSKEGQFDIFNYSNVKIKGDQELKDFQKGNLVWFVALSIQNNQLKLINYKDYLSPQSFTLQKISNKQIKVNLQQLTMQKNKQYDFEKKQSFTFKSSNNIKMFGFTSNISQSYQSYNYLTQFKTLIQLEKYPHLNMPRKNDTDIVDWENKQIQQIKKGTFDSKYTFVIIYGTIDRNTLLQAKSNSIYPNVFVTNSTNKKQFDSKKFDIMAFQNQQNLFKSKLNNVVNQKDQKFVHHVIYNLLGGLAYYQGKLYTQNSIMSHQHDYSFTFTPSRLIFPRSFLWDDGFHTTIMATYKPELTMKILHSWFKKVDLFGWIGRQQIRGFESSSMMPDMRFIYQDVFELNPPTIVMPVLKMLQNKNIFSQQVNQKLQALLQNHFPSLQKHFRYFIKTQSHYDLAYKQDLQTTIKYRWRCKDQCAKGNFMGSGLDDYPRVEQKNQISKQHIDLSSWLWFFSDALQNIASYLQKNKAQKFYNKWKHELRQKIIDQCLDQTDMLFKDLAVKGANIYLDQKVSKIGYINLFPFFVGLLQTYENDSPQRRQKILNIMMDENILMSKGGLRSLSLNDTDYASQQNYWRGASWMPINYMVLRACKKYYWNIQSQIHRKQVHKLYNELRSRLIEAVQKNYEKSGYLFENYIEGEGNRGYPFYGWTSLIASIITQNY